MWIAEQLSSEIENGIWKSGFPGWFRKDASHVPRWMDGGLTDEQIEWMVSFLPFFGISCCAGDHCPLDQLVGAAHRK